MKTIQLKTSFIMLFCLSVFLQLQAENPCEIMYPRGETEYWGIGAYIIGLDFEITLYQSKNEDEDCGILVNKNGFMKLLDHYENAQSFEHTDIEWIGSHKSVLLKVYEEEGKFVRVLNNSFAEGLFIKKKEV